MNLEEFMLKEGWVQKRYLNWVQKCYLNCGVKYIAWHKEGVQIDEGSVEEMDKEEDANGGRNNEIKN